MNDKPGMVRSYRILALWGAIVLACLYILASVLIATWEIIMWATR